MSQVHSHVDMGRQGGGEGGFVLPFIRHTMAITTQLTLSIYTTVHACRDARAHTHANSTVRSEKTFFSPSIDPVILTAIPVVRPVKLDKKKPLELMLFHAN